MTDTERRGNHIVPSRRAARPNDGLPGLGLVTPAAYAEHVLRGLTEAQFDAKIEALCNLYGVWSYHAPRNVRRCSRCGQNIRTASRAGWPDRTYILRSGAKVLFRELKTWTGKVEPEQMQVLVMLAAAGMDAKIWRPQDWQEIVQTLSEGRTL